MSVGDGLKGDWRGISWKMSIIAQQRDDKNLEPRLRQENEEKGRDTEEVGSVGRDGQ